MRRFVGEGTNIWFAALVLGCSGTVTATTDGAVDVSDAPRESVRVDVPLADDSSALDASTINVNCPLGYAFWNEPDGAVHLERVLLCSEFAETRPGVCCLSSHVTSFEEYPYERSWPVRCVTELACRPGGIVGRPPWQ